MIDLSRLEQEVTRLLAEADDIAGFVRSDCTSIFSSWAGSSDSSEPLNHLRLRYQQWYGTALQLIALNMPIRGKEFQALYSRGSQQLGGLAIRDILLGQHGSVLHCDVFCSLLQSQSSILASMPSVVRARALDIGKLVSAQLLDDEVSRAGHLLTHGFVRAAGALAGVALERHLKDLCNRAQPPIKVRKHAQIGQLNDALREQGCISDPDWRKIAWMAEIRNRCDHHRESEPRRQDVSEMIVSLQEFLEGK